MISFIEDRLENEEGSNASSFGASTIPSFLKTLITQNLKLRSQNKLYIGYDLDHFIYACMCKK